MHRETRLIETMLQNMVSDGATADAVADAAVWLWQATSATLAPIIGQQGIAALYKRSLRLSGSTYPWLMAVQDNAVTPHMFEALHRALSQQDASDAAVAAGAMLTTFHDLLASLIGASLTERLLRPIWPTSSSGHTVKDINAP